MQSRMPAKDWDMIECILMEHPADSEALAKVEQSKHLRGTLYHHRLRLHVDAVRHVLEELEEGERLFIQLRFMDGRIVRKNRERRTFEDLEEETGLTAKQMFSTELLVFERVGLLAGVLDPMEYKRSISYIPAGWGTGHEGLSDAPVWNGPEPGKRSRRRAPKTA